MPTQGAARAPRDAARCSPGGQRLCDRPNRRTTVGRVSGAPHREPLVGRGRELEVARQLLQAAVDGRPQLLTLSGEVGIGKSRLARAIAAEASRHGALTLWGAGQEDLSLPYLPVSMALAPLSVDGPGLLDPGSQGAGADADPVRMWGNVTQAVLAAASQRPVVLVMDDLQWTEGRARPSCCTSWWCSTTRPPRRRCGSSPSSPCAPHTTRSGPRACCRASSPAGQGMWVVSQTYHRPWPTPITVESGMGEWKFPTHGLAFASEGPVVVVAPPEKEGGVLNPPRPWMPHP